MTLNTKRSKVSHTHIATTHDSQISLHIALRLAIFELQAILRQCYMVWDREEDPYDRIMIG